MTPLIERIHSVHLLKGITDPACSLCIAAKPKLPEWVKRMASNAHELTPGRA